MVYGAIEAGGTKFVCAVGDHKGNIVNKTTISTRKPAETIRDISSFFEPYELESVGIGSFGPIDLNKNSPAYGTILNTSKLAWKNFDILGALKKELDVPVFIDTDVNVAALGEYTYGEAKQSNSCLYITVGTGIGAGAVFNGETFTGTSHPEMGHILVAKHSSDDYQGICPYHDHCLEGFASGPAIEDRWGEKGTDLVNKDEVWELEAYYLAQALMNYILILSPQKIIMGGGVMKQKQLFPLINQHLNQMLGGYVEFDKQDDCFIVPPGLGDEAGIKGALTLGMKIRDQISL